MISAALQFATTSQRCMPSPHTNSRAFRQSAHHTPTLFSRASIRCGLAAIMFDMAARSSLEFACVAWLCSMLVMLGVCVSLYRVSGAYRKKGEGVTDLDSMPARFQRAHGNLSEWLGAVAALAFLSSHLGLGDRGILAEYSGLLTLLATVGITLHRIGMLMIGLKQAHPVKLAGMTTFYVCMSMLCMRCLHGFVLA